MPSNEQRREAAKRKLERQLERRAERARKRRVLTIAGTVLAVVLLAGGIAAAYLFAEHNDDSNDASTSSAAPTSGAPEAAALPAPTAKPATVQCSYTATPQQPAARTVTPPKTDSVPTDGKNAQVSMSISTSEGPIGVTLDNAHAPCTVNSFVSLAGQGYFDGTNCHRLTTEGIKVLQCGDPTGTGQGGPGYQFANEYPSDQIDPTDPASGKPSLYKRGVLAMANAGPGTNGSQFFLVYGDSPLKPDYTVFGTIDEAGLATLDKIAAGGLEAGNVTGDGKPATPVTVNSVRLD